MFGEGVVGLGDHHLDPSPTQITLIGLGTEGGGEGLGRGLGRKTTPWDPPDPNSIHWAGDHVAFATFQRLRG